MLVLVLVPVLVLVLLLSLAVEHIPDMVMPERGGERECIAV